MTRLEKKAFVIGVGIASMAYGTIIGIINTFKASKKIEAKKQETGADKLTPSECVKEVGPLYVPVVVSTVAGAACIATNSIELARANSAITIAANLAEDALRTYQDKVRETFGEKKEERVLNDICADKVRENPPDIKEVIVTSKGNTLMFDELSGRYFESDIESVKHSINVLNKQMLEEDYIVVNDYNYELGLRTLPEDNRRGWNISRGYLDVYFGSCISEDGRPCITLYHRVPPRSDYAK